MLGLRIFALMFLSGATAVHAQTCPSGISRVAPDGRYSVTQPVTGQYVVTDLATGLTWKRCPEGQSGLSCTGTGTTHAWTQALTIANGSTHAGFSDWRLPNRHELQSLVETGCHTPAINSTIFPATVSGPNFFWSSTTASDATEAWSITFTSGTVGSSKKIGASRVRLVRSGQGLDIFSSELDAVPSAFSLLPQVSVPLADQRTSESITVAGLTTRTGIGVSGSTSSSYSINGGPYTNLAGTVANGDVVRVRHTSAATYSSTTTTVLSIGGVTGEFVTQTRFAIGLNDTAQVNCYNASANTGTVSGGTTDPEESGFDEQDCTRGAAAADVLGRMVKVGASTAPGRDYTKIANDGSELPASAALGTGPSDWGCTRDNVTGLIWEVKVNDSASLRHLNHTYTWYDSNATVNGGNAGTLGTNVSCINTLTNCNTTAYRNAVNALVGSARLCGATDWRLPSVKELRSLVQADASSVELIDTTWFPNTSPSRHWSGENYANSPDSAWLVTFVFGTVSAETKNNTRSVRLVRGGP